MKLRFNHAIWLPLSLTLTMLLSTFLYWQNEERELYEKRQLTFADSADHITESIRERLSRYDLILRGVKGLVEASDAVSREEFRIYIATLHLLQRQSGLQGVAVAQYVSRRALTGHEADMRRRDFKDYRVKPAGAGPYAPITLIEPYSGLNLQAIGYDILSNPVVKPALEYARDTGGLAMTGRLTLIQDAQADVPAPAAIVMYLPIYGNAAQLDTLDGRREGIIGWVSGPFRVRDLIDPLMSTLKLSDIGLDIYEGHVADSDRHLYGKGDAHRDDMKPVHDLHANRTIDMGGSYWTLVMYSLPAYEERFSEHNQWLIAIFGVALSLLLGGLSWLLTTGHARAVAVAEVMTREMRHVQADLEATLHAIPDILFELGLDGRFHKCSTSHLVFATESHDNFLGKNLADVFPAQASAICMAALHEAHQAGFSFGKSIEVYVGDETRWYELSVSSKDTSAETNIFFIMILRNITDRMQIEHELRIAATAFDSQEAMLLTDANQIILRVNQAFTSITGYTQEEVVGKTPALLNSGRQDKAFYQAMWESLNRDQFWSGEIWNRRKSGEIYPERLSVTSVLNATGKVSNYIGLFTDISKIKQAEDRIHLLAYYDTLTGLPNRQMLMEHLKERLSAGAGKTSQSAILFINLDDIKSLNDGRGHDSGDLLLIETARRIKSCVYSADIVARLGSDEFVVVLGDLSQKLEKAAKQAEEVAQRIASAIKKSLNLFGFEYHCTACIGISLFRDQETSVEGLIKHADAALFQAKQAGRDKIHFFDSTMQLALEQRVQLESMLRKAIPHQFQLYYQLQADRYGKIFGAEVLIRWMHPEKGMISPMSFIPLAEQTGLILPIGRWVLETACQQLKAWETDALTRDLILAVNVSAKQFHQVDFVEQVLEVLRQTGANPGRLKLELTESLLVENVETIIAKMNVLKSKGVSFSLDDFGTGFSSLSFLKRLPLDQLKIDQSFVRDLLTDPNDAAIVRAVITLGQSLGLSVIAEGVETEEQRNFLAINGCHNYQGYLFSKPVPVTDFEKLITK